MCVSATIIRASRTRLRAPNALFTPVARDDRRKFTYTSFQPVNTAVPSRKHSSGVKRMRGPSISSKEINTKGSDRHSLTDKNTTVTDEVDLPDIKGGVEVFEGEKINSRENVRREPRVHWGNGSGNSLPRTTVTGGHVRTFHCEVSLF